MNRLFDEFVAGAPERGDTRLTFPGGTWDFLPDVDVAETGKEMRVTVELPGVDEKDLDVRLDGDTLTIRGEKREETSERDGKWTHSECCYGSFVRSVPLGAEVDAGRVDATFKKGVLKIRLPKMKTSARDQGRIKVKAG